MNNSFVFEILNAIPLFKETQIKMDSLVEEFISHPSLHYSEMTKVEKLGLLSYLEECMRIKLKNKIEEI